MCRPKIKFWGFSFVFSSFRFLNDRYSVVACKCIKFQKYKFMKDRPRFWRPWVRILVKSCCFLDFFFAAIALKSLFYFINQTLSSHSHLKILLCEISTPRNALESYWKMCPAFRSQPIEFNGLAPESLRWSCLHTWHAVALLAKRQSRLAQGGGAKVENKSSPREPENGTLCRRTPSLHRDRD